MKCDDVWGWLAIVLLIMWFMAWITIKIIKAIP